MKKALILLVAILPLLLIFTSCEDKPGSSTDDGGTESDTIYYTLTIKNGEDTTTEKVKKARSTPFPLRMGRATSKAGQ